MKKALQKADGTIHTVHVSWQYGEALPGFADITDKHYIGGKHA